MLTLLVQIKLVIRRPLEGVNNNNSSISRSFLTEDNVYKLPLGKGIVGEVFLEKSEDLKKEYLRNLKKNLSFKKVRFVFRHKYEVSTSRHKSKDLLTLRLASPLSVGLVRALALIRVNGL
jgi:hypothetical protein